MRSKTASTNEYLAFLSAKYEVDPDRLFCALVLAEEGAKSMCGDLSIERRAETRDSVMFLIQASSEVVAQVSVLKEFLLDKGHPIRDFMGTDKVRRYMSKKARLSSVPHIRDLRNGMAQVCLTATVLEISKPNIVYTRYGNYASVANALIADETGTIRLCLWNEQISGISAGDTIKVKNARASMFRGQKQLNIGKNGLLNKLDELSCPDESGDKLIVPLPKQK